MREPGDPVTPRRGWRGGPRGEVQGRKLSMNGRGKSDRCVVPSKPLNKAGIPAAEEAEGRRLAKENLQRQNMLRTQGRERMTRALERVRQAAGREKKGRLTALLHHLCNVDTLREAYFSL